MSVLDGYAAVLRTKIYEYVRYIMNDSYVECLVARKQNGLYPVAKVILIIILAIGLVLGLFGTYVFLIPAILSALILFLLLPNMNLEYEYLYINREISIDKIMNKEKRKTVINIELDKMELMCPLNSHELDSYKARKIKITDYSSKDKDAKIFVLVCRMNNEDKLIAIEPNEEMLKAIKSIAPRKVIEY